MGGPRVAEGPTSSLSRKIARKPLQALRVQHEDLPLLSSEDPFPAQPIEHTGNGDGAAARHLGELTIGQTRLEARLGIIDAGLWGC